jgi:hypothetical protein
MSIMILINQRAKAIFVTLNGPIRFDIILYDKIHYDALQYITAQHNTIQSNLMRFNARTQHHTALHHTHYNTPQNSRNAHNSMTSPLYNKVHRSSSTWSRAMPSAWVMDRSPIVGPPGCC